MLRATLIMGIVVPIVGTAGIDTVSAQRIAVQPYVYDRNESCLTFLAPSYEYVYVGHVRPKDAVELTRKWVWFGKIPGSSRRTDGRVVARFDRLGLPPNLNEPTVQWVVHRHVWIEYSDQNVPRIPPPEIAGWQGDHSVFVPHPDGGWRAKRFASAVWDHVKGIEIVQTDVGPPADLPLPDVIVRGVRLP